MTPRTILLTGGAGFIGCNFARMILGRTSYRLVVLDALTYSGRRENLSGLEEHGDRFRFEHGDIRDATRVGPLVREADLVVNMAAESHVDHSIVDPLAFVRTNVVGTQVLLDAFRSAMDDGRARRLVHVSTDEVYGSLPLDSPERFTESHPMLPSSPYAASKAGGDALVRAACTTHGIDAVITRCSNNFGPYQHTEKLIPLFLTNLFAGEPVPLYGDGLNVRDWIHVDDHCEAVLAAAERGVSGAVYNIGADNERSNIELTRELLRITGRSEDLVQRVPDRPGHDRRYAIDPAKTLRDLGWSASRSEWPRALEETASWYERNEAWWRPLRDGASARV